MRLAIPCLIASVALTSVVGCGSSTTVEDTWKAPDTSKLAFEKILVIAVSSSETFRHKAEDRLARELRGAEVVKSYTLLPDGDSLEDKAKVQEIIAQNAIDGVVTLRIVSRETEVEYFPPMYPSSYYAFGSYYGPRYGLAPYYYDQGQVTTTEVVGVETNVYEARGGRLVWSGLTSTKDPDDTDELLKETIEAIQEELREEKLVP